MKTLKRSIIVLSLAVGAFAVSNDSEVRLRADLTGVGKGKVVVKTKGSETEVEAEGQNVARNATFTVTVGGRNFTVVSNGFGTYHLERKFRGTGAPVVAVGDTTTVKNAAGATIQSGKFIRVR